MSQPSNLSITGAYDTNGGMSLNDIRFDCPKCGAPYTVWVKARFNGPIESGIWAWSVDSENRVTISPSINNHNHGKKKDCGWHGSLIQGELQP